NERISASHRPASSSTTCPAGRASITSTSGTPSSRAIWIVIRLEFSSIFARMAAARAPAGMSVIAAAGSLTSGMSCLLLFRTASRIGEGVVVFRLQQHAEVELQLVVLAVVRRDERVTIGGPEDKIPHQVEWPHAAGELERHGLRINVAQAVLAAVEVL